MKDKEVLKIIYIMLKEKKIKDFNEFTNKLKSLSHVI